MEIRAEQLKKVYGSGEAAVTALQPCTFRIESGERVAIMGESGSGKSTLLHLLGGLDTPTGGTVYWDGEAITGKSETQLAGLRLKKVGVVFQAYNLLPEMTARENILLPLLLAEEKPDEAYLRQITDWLELGDRLNHLPSQLSGGQQQRVAMARALANKPSLLLCDEPTGNLDSRNAQSVVELLDRVTKQYGQTVILVTHSRAIAERFPRMLTIRDGMVKDGAE